MKEHFHNPRLHKKNPTEDALRKHRNMNHTRQPLAVRGDSTHTHHLASKVMKVTEQF
jgi:hypothetical protein